MIKTKHFSIHELVPPEIYEKFGERAWMFIDPRLVLLIHQLREEFGRVSVNDYYWGGNRVASGLRVPTSPHYSPTSQHSHGRAVDMIFNDISASDVRKRMTENPEKWLAIVPSITLESDVSWVHVDVRNNHPCINVFKP
jgi:uncharacterized protein YcbK (DUF882 family)